MSAQDRPIRGVLSVFQTPFHEDESIDFSTLMREIEWLFDNGADGIVMAMVSETLRLSGDERKEVAEAACIVGRPRGHVVISVGAESSRVAEALAQHAELAGASAVMAIPPVSVAVPDDALRTYYERILQATALPVIVQDASGYVGRLMSITLQADLFNRFGQRVMFKPEAAPIGPRLSALRTATNGQAAIFEGSGGIALVESYQRGIWGTMPGADLVDVIVALWRALEAGNDVLAHRIHAPLAAMISLQPSLDAFLAVEKHILCRRGIFPNTTVRSPAGFALDPVTIREVNRLLDELLEVINPLGKNGTSAPIQSL